MPDAASTLIHQLMTTKIVTVSMDDSLRSVQQLFDAHHFHHVLVTERRKLVGVVSDRDLLKNLSPFLGHALSERHQDLATLDKRVHQIMSRKPITVTPDTNVATAIELILLHHVSCLPVVDDQQHPVGIVTWRDILRHTVGGNRPS